VAARPSAAANLVVRVILIGHLIGVGASSPRGAIQLGEPVVSGRPLVRSG
jgi:hypothetical protein